MDKHYLGQKFRLSELEHHYGPNVHLLSDPVLSTQLAQLCSAETKQPLANQIVRLLYQSLIQAAANQELHRKPRRVTTRMASQHPEAAFTAELIDTEQPVVSVNLARAGTYPSHICYEFLSSLLNPDLARQDHIMMSRQTNEKHEVTGALPSGYKIGGPVDNALVFFPDPMGATGGTICEVLDLYKNLKPGRAKKYIALHLIVTPEYLRNVQKRHSDLVVYALRLDRGLSPPDVLSTRPGEKWDQERGLNRESYIVPGGGGFGEILNNAYV